MNTLHNLIFVFRTEPWPLVFVMAGVLFIYYAAKWGLKTR